jgi:hypothetical protein
MPSALVALTNIHRPNSTESANWSVSFYVSGHGVKGRLLVPVGYGIFEGGNIPKVARDRLRLFAGALADSTTGYALTDQQVIKLRKDYQANVFLR